MRSVVRIPAPSPLPPIDGAEEEFAPDECYSEALVELFLEEYTRPGDLVLDPFAGSGTTLVVAERMGRRAVGLELQPERVAMIRERLADPSAIREGDARDLGLGSLGLPRADFCMTSPPYMTRTRHPENPLNGYRTLDGDYARYLAELALVARRLRTVLLPEAYVVINAANLVDDVAGDIADGLDELEPTAPIETPADRSVTPLAWDIGYAVSTQLRFEREIVLDWERPPAWLTNDYALVFRAAPPAGASDSERAGAGVPRHDLGED